MEVLVFKTTVSTPENVKMLKPLLDSSAGRGKWNFALDDCDKILRIQSSRTYAQIAVQMLMEKGFNCIELED
jgi:hypothetical protein